MPKIVVEQGKDSGAETLVVDTLVVGRDLSCGIVLHDQQSSRKHCAFEMRGERLFVKDLSSRNGILVNGVRMPEAELKTGDRVTVGGSILRVAEGLLGPWSAKTVSGYRFLDKIGEGGMGEVYRAEQVSMRRHVAAKVLSARLHENPKYVERLLKEARAAAQFNHPGLIQVHDVIQDPAITFFSMELVQGQTLRECLRRGPASLSQVISVARQVLEALRYAHAKGIVHHDVKPENIMVADDGTVKLADLGIAQPAGTQLQASGSGKRVLLGTPQYMGPDQVTGDRVDPRFDLYSLGATLYHALCGRPPYRGATAEEIVKQVCAAPPAHLGSLVPSLPPDVVAFVERLMERDPEKRIPTADAALKLLNALAAKYGGESGGASTTTGAGTGTAHETPLPPADAPAPQAPPHPRKAKAGNGGAAVLATLLILAAAGGVAYAAKVAGRNRTPQPTPPTPAPSKPPAVAPPKPPPSDTDAAHALIRARFARDKQDFDVARREFALALTLSPTEAERREAEEALTAIDSDRAEAAAAKEWGGLLLVLDASPEAERVKLLGDFIQRHPRTRPAAEADRRLDAVLEEKRRLEGEASAAATALAAEVQGLVRPQDQPLFLAALGRLQAFDRGPHAAHLTPAKRQELDELRRHLLDEQKRFYETRRLRFQELLDQERFSDARKVLDDLAAIPGEGWAKTIQLPLSRWQKAVDAYVDARVAEARQKRGLFDLAGAEQAYARLSDTLAATPYEARARAWLDRARLIASTQQSVLQLVASLPKERQFRIPVPNLGTGRVKSATEDQLEVFLPGGAVTTVPWKSLTASDLVALWRHYLDLRQASAHAAVFALCWEGGLWDEAAKEMEKADLGKHPGFEAEFVREKGGN